LGIEDNFCPHSTYSAFTKNNKENENLLEELAYAINETVAKLRKTKILDQDVLIRSLPDSKLLEVFELISNEKLKEIKDFFSKLSEKVKASPCLDYLCHEEGQRFLLQKQIKNYSEELKKKDEALKEKEKEEKKLKDQIESLKNTKSEETSKDFSHEYAKIREKFENQTRNFWQLIFLKNKQKKDEEKLSLEVVKKLCLKVVKFFFFIFVSPLSFFFNLHSKICFLRLITYAIPICLFVFHACGFFGYRWEEAPKWMKSSFFVGENSKDKNPKEADLKPSKFPEINFSTTKSGINFEQNSQKNYQKNSSESKSYLYFHLALITTLLIAFQQLRSAIAEMKAKKNLIEVYRHRELVARNFNEMRQIVEGDVSSQIQVTKSAAKALFENEPSIKENPTSTKDFGITNNFKPGANF
jgi:hypothetical protein